MTTHTMRPGSPGTGTRPEMTDDQGRSLITFAAVVLGVLGFFNLLDGIAAIANSHVFVNNAVYVVGDLRAWGWVAVTEVGSALNAAVSAEKAVLIAVILIVAVPVASFAA